MALLNNYEAPFLLKTIIWSIGSRKNQEVYKRAYKRR